MKRLIPWVTCIMLSACSQNGVINRLHDELRFSELESDFAVTDINRYGCEKINSAVLSHILEYGTITSQRKLHDHYDTTGCTVDGVMLKNGQPVSFTFDYGGIFYFSDGSSFACGKACCQSDFQYCSFDEQSLKGN